MPLCFSLPLLWLFVMGEQEIVQAQCVGKLFRMGRELGSYIITRVALICSFIG